MQNEFDSLIEQVERASVKKAELERQKAVLEQERDCASEQEQNALLAKELVLQVAQRTQLNIGGRISELVSLALAAVFDNPYRFNVEFTQLAGRTQARLLFERDDNSFEPLLASGGGALDIASFALRLSVWTLARTRPLFILDEPFRNLSLDLQGKAGLLLRELARKLSIQIVIVSHNPEIISGADRVFRVANGKIEVE